MIWFVLGFFGFMVWLIWFIKEEWGWSDWFDRIFFPFVGILISFVISVLCFLFSSIFVSEFAEVNYTKTKDIEIMALKDNQNANGNFFVMGGYIDEDLYYYYAKKTELGYKTEKVKAENSYIKYTNDKPHIETYKAEFKSNAAYVFAMCMTDNRYIIYCPENTITTEYAVDLE